jgi:SanA protein
MKKNFQVKLNRKLNIKSYLSRIDLNTKLIGKVLLHILFYSILLFLIINWSIESIYEDRIYQFQDEIQDKEYAIVPGASSSGSFGDSEILEDRAEVAIQLYKRGDVQRIFVSGVENGEINEVQIIRDKLLEEDIPEFVIITDNKSSRSYDICYTAKVDKNINQAIIVTQAFHMSRMLYLCNSLGIESEGIIADRSLYQNQRYLSLREEFATIRAALDINILRPHTYTE